MNKQTEIERLKGIITNTEPDGFIVEIVADCDGNASEVSERCREILLKVLNSDLSFDASLDKWKEILPKWFVSSCDKELTKCEAEELLKTSVGHSILGNNWTLSGFIFWFRSEQRHWYWWDSKIADPNTLIIQILTYGHPFPWEALKWLLEVSGATDVE